MMEKEALMEQKLIDQLTHGKSQWTWRPGWRRRPRPACSACRRQPRRCPGPRLRPRSAAPAPGPRRSRYSGWSPGSGRR